LFLKISTEDLAVHSARPAKTWERGKEERNIVLSKASNERYACDTELDAAAAAA
jgi:hypothetical protein